jgi:HlyD family secretion protein
MIFKALMVLLAASILAGCNVFGGGSPTPLPTVVLGSPNTAPQAPSASSTTSPGSGATASGVIIPAQQAQLSATLGVNVAAVDVAIGDQVKAGQVLVRLAGSEKLAADVEAANLELLSSQQALQTLKDNAGQARSAAQVRLANAQKALDDAQRRRGYRNYRNGSQADIDAAHADLILANSNLKTAEDNYKAVENLSEDDVNRATALSALAAAQKAQQKAVANLNFLLALPKVIDVNQAEADLQAAQAEVNNAQVAYDKLKNGLDPDALALAEERVKHAQTQLAASQTALADLELKAPFDGTVSKVDVHSGEWVIPGQQILALADLAHLRVETTDLSERDIPRIKIGQTVTVLVKALNQNVTGRVSEIAPLSDTLGGDVVYKTTIDLTTLPEGLRAGMSVEVQF